MRPWAPRSALTLLLLWAGCSCSCASCGSTTTPEQTVRAPIGPETALEDDRAHALEQRHRLACGTNHACALDADGKVRCWGDAALALGAPEGSFVTLAAGRFTTCGLRADQSVACWGPPGGAGTEAPETDLVSITAGDEGACGLGADMVAVCWQYPGGSSVEGAPSERLRTLETWGETTCALRPDGTPVCWGFDPTQGDFPSNERFRAIAVGWLKLCGSSDDGVMRCWGEGPREPFGDEPMTHIAGHSGGGVCGLTRAGAHARCFGFDERVEMPARVDGPFEDVVVGQYYACGLESDGSLRCWGSAPGATPEGSFEEVVACDGSVCGRRADGTVECAGSPYYGQAHPPEGTFEAVASGRDRSCALRSPDRSVACWGGPPSLPFEPPDGAFASLELGDGWACGLRDDGRAECWGNMRNRTDAPSDPDARFAHLDVGGGMACGITREHTARCWGENSTDLPIGSLTDVAEVETSASFVMVRHLDDHLTCFTMQLPNGGGGGSPAMHWAPAACPVTSAREIVATDALTCWLTDHRGLECRFQGPDGTMSEPRRVAASEVRDIVATYDVVCARFPDDHTECWGNNGWAETEVPRGARFTAVAPGYHHACALDPEAHLVCWGSYAGTLL